MGSFLLFLIKFKLLLPLLILMIVLLMPFMIETISSLYLMTSTLITDSVGEVAALGEASTATEVATSEVSGVSVGNSTLVGTELTDPVVTGADITGTEEAIVAPEETTFGEDIVGEEKPLLEDVAAEENMAENTIAEDLTTTEQSVGSAVNF